MLQIEVACRPLEQIQEWMPEEEKTAVAAKSSGSTYRLLCDLAQLLSLGNAVARARQIQPTPESVERLFTDGDFALGPEANNPTWAENNDLDDAGFSSLVERLARVRALLDDGEKTRRASREIDKYLLALLRVHSEYEQPHSAQQARGHRRDAAVLVELERQDREKFLLFRRLAKLWRAVDGAAKRRGIYTEVLQEVLQDWCDRFRLERGLKSRRATEAWLRRNNLNDASFADLVTGYSRLSCLFYNAQTSTVGTDEIDENVCWLHDTLRLTGWYGRFKQTKAHSPSKGKLEYARTLVINDSILEARV